MYCEYKSIRMYRWDENVNNLRLKKFWNRVIIEVNCEIKFLWAEIKKMEFKYRDLTYSSIILVLCRFLYIPVFHK